MSKEIYQRKSFINLGTRESLENSIPFPSKNIVPTELSFENKQSENFQFNHKFNIGTIRTDM